MRSISRSLVETSKTYENSADLLCHLLQLVSQLLQFYVS